MPRSEFYGRLISYPKATIAFSASTTVFRSYFFSDSGRSLYGTRSGSLFLAVVPFHAVSPTFIDALLCPVIVVVLSQPLYEFLEIRAQSDLRGINRFGSVSCHRGSCSQAQSFGAARADHSHSRPSAA